MNWTPENRAKLGTMPDGALAALLGISREAVIMKRRRDRIRAYQARGRPPKQQAEA